MLPQHKAQEPRSESQEMAMAAHMEYHMARSPGLRQRGIALPPLDERVFDSEVGNLKRQVGTGMQCVNTNNNDIMITRFQSED